MRQTLFGVMYRQITSAEGRQEKSVTVVAATARRKKTHPRGVLHLKHYGLLLLLLLAIGERVTRDRLLGHHKPRPSVGPMLNSWPHSDAVSSLCPFSFRSPATLRQHYARWLCAAIRPRQRYSSQGS